MRFMKVEKAEDKTRRGTAWMNIRKNMSFENSTC